MLARFSPMLLLLVALSARSQTDSAPASDNSSSDTRMILPPVVSGIAYPTLTGAEQRSNYLNLDLHFSIGYLDNAYPGSGSPVSDITNIVRSTLSIDRTSDRLHESLSYSPGFVFDEPTSQLNQSTQNASLAFEYRLSPHVSVRAADTVSKTSSFFDQPQSSEIAVSGSPQSITPGIIAPFAEEVTNTASVEAAWQFSLTNMIGAAGSAGLLDFPNPAQATGLYNSTSRGASGFYVHRLTAGQYLGANLQYSIELASPQGINSTVQTAAPMLFYSVYITPTFTFSLSGGPQYSSIAATSVASEHAWSPSGVASIAWQGQRTNLTASYNRTVTSGGGLIGAFQSSSAALGARWQAGRTWTLAGGANYAVNKNITPASSGSAPALPIFEAYSGGRTISGSASLEHRMGNRLALALTYARLHQKYPGVAAISASPNSDQVLVSLSYAFSRPLGR